MCCVIQKQEEVKDQEDVINTNGTKDMKDEKEVQEDLDNLRPTYRDIQQINNLLDETKSDDKMQNSQFMEFLRNLKNKPPVADQNFDQSQLWANQFQVRYFYIIYIHIMLHSILSISNVYIVPNT